MRRSIINNIIKLSISFGVIVGCSSSSFEVLNPYADSNPPEALLGEANTNAIRSELGGDAQDARHALNVMGQYQRAHAPQPTNPVIQPAEVRLMWVPDHLNSAGDLVPAHYYYLKVLNDRWAVQDAFDFNHQLNQGTSSHSTTTPWVYSR